jgi:hypothetical protein
LVLEHPAEPAEEERGGLAFDPQHRVDRGDAVEPRQQVGHVAGGGLVALGARVARVRYDYAPAVPAAVLPAVPGLSMASWTGPRVTAGVLPGAGPRFPAFGAAWCLVQAGVLCAPRRAGAGRKAPFDATSEV